MHLKTNIPAAAWITATRDDSNRKQKYNAEQVELQLLAPGESVPINSGACFSLPITFQFDPDSAPRGWLKEFGWEHPDFGNIPFDCTFFEGPAGLRQFVSGKTGLEGLTPSVARQPCSLPRPGATALHPSPDITSAGARRKLNPKSKRERPV
jgi:hypothetical protein